MPTLPIILYPSKILRMVSTPIKDYKPKAYSDLIESMIETMVANKGIGLAAAQIGKNIRLIVVQTKEGALPLINPKTLSESWKKETSEEGCLSIPKVFGLVKRSRAIKVSALNREGDKIEFEAEGLFARVILHEIDHINGVLFIDRAKKITSGKEYLKRYDGEK